VAPPKRKTTGRTTPKGTRPGEAPRPGTGSTAQSASSSSGVAASTRYTPPTGHDLDESPPWVPILMAVLLGLGALTILLRYLVWQDSNYPVLVGLAFLLGGLFTATKWK
jgi:hypothetical protein